MIELLNQANKKINDLKGSILKEKKDKVEELERLLNRAQLEYEDVHQDIMYTLGKYIDCLETVSNGKELDDTQKAFLKNFTA